MREPQCSRLTKGEDVPPCACPPWESTWPERERAQRNSYFSNCVVREVLKSCCNARLGQKGVKLMLTQTFHPKTKMRKIHLAVLSAATLAFGSFTLSARADVIADWTFETSAPVTAGPFAPESGTGALLSSDAASGKHVGTAAYSSPAGNGSAKSFSSNTWAVGDYYEFDVNTAGFSGISVSFDQTGSATGPAAFKIQYNDGTGWIDLAGDAYNIPTTTTTTGGTTAPGTGTTVVTWSSTVSQVASTFSFDLSSITSLTGIRIMDNGTAALGNSSTGVGAGGTDRVDNVIFSGTAAGSVPEPATVGIAAAGAAFMIGRRRRR
jgi:hypothetical protein